ncbi:MAG TPA: hypothetical protein VNC50_02175 [Planctomycetia bacterium]|jgi:hypothetical protein|nr:hypothetical protein [Planctomycetia bacterium]
MSRERILVAAALSLVLLPQDAMAQRRGGGGAVRSGVRGAAVGGMVGGEAGAEKGAKIGVVTGATRTAMNRETAARTQYQSTAAYQSAPKSNFSEAPPEVFGAAAPGEAANPGVEAVIRKEGKPLVGVTFPADWKQTTGGNYISAVSGDGQAYVMLITLDGVTDKDAGVAKVKTGLGNYLQDIQWGEPTQSKRGGVVITGSGKAKKAGVEVVFATGVLDAGGGKLVGVAFVVDSKIEEYYKETVKGICETLRLAGDFAKD